MLSDHCQRELARHDGEPAKSSGFPLSQKVIDTESKEIPSYFSSSALLTCQLWLCSADCLFGETIPTPSLGRGQRCILIMKMKQSWVMLQELIHHVVQTLRRREMWEGFCFTSYSSSIQMIKRDPVISCHCEPCGWTWLHLTGWIQIGFMRIKLIQDKQRCFRLKSVWIESQLFRNHRNFDGNKGRWLPCKGNLHLLYHLTEGKGWAFPQPWTSVSHWQDCKTVSPCGRIL